MSISSQLSQAIHDLPNKDAVCVLRSSAGICEDSIIAGKCRDIDAFIAGAGWQVPHILDR